MAIPKRKSLAGTCGIPMERNCIYVVTLDEYGVAKSYPFDPVPEKMSAPGLGVWDIRVSSSRRNSGGKYSETCAPTAS